MALWRDNTRMPIIVKGKGIARFNSNNKIRTKKIELYMQMTIYIVVFLVVKFFMDQKYLYLI